jgi:tripartite ATP-independent transporter DctM subunit
MMVVQTIGLIGMGGLALLIFLRVPVGVAMGLVGMCGYAAANGWARAFTVFGDIPFDAATNYDLSVIPMFLLMGELAARSGRSAGLARKALDIFVPTSIALILYSLISEQSISKLLAAALLPTVALAMLYATIGLALAVIECDRAPHNVLGAAKNRLRDAAAAWDMVLIFGLSFGGLYAGWFSPNKAGGIGAVAAFVIGVARRSLSWPALREGCSDVIRTTCVLFLIVMGAFIFSYFVVQTHLPGLLIGWMKQGHVGRNELIAVLILSYIAADRFLDGSAMILIAAPIFLPVAVQYRYDPIWFGVMLVIAIELGLLQRPAIRSCVPEEAIPGTHRMTRLIAPIALLVILVAWPQLALWLPNLLYR